MVQLNKHPLLWRVYELCQLIEQLPASPQQTALVTAASALLDPIERLAEWRAAIIDAAIVDWVYTPEHETNPRKAINDLCVQAQRIALDPAVSADAKVLHDRIAHWHQRATEEAFAKGDALRERDELALQVKKLNIAFDFEHKSNEDHIKQIREWVKANAPGGWIDDLRKRAYPETCCTWTDDGEGNWETSCHEIFILCEGTPKENDMKFCPYCGKPLEEFNPNESDA